MELYYHRTDGGAEYYSTKPEGPEFINGIVLRVDGNEIEVYSSNILRQGISLVVQPTNEHDGFQEFFKRGKLFCYELPR